MTTLLQGNNFTIWLITQYVEIPGTRQLHCVDFHNTYDYQTTESW